MAQSDQNQEQSSLVWNSSAVHLELDNPKPLGDSGFLNPLTPTSD